ncbi:hypothetical protein [Burkholderia multivorans]|uniref:hypothetical protein n=1 Tax=Burkholderia multivorans TaxID=87883 RepID=UPI000A8F6E1C|nr:hypothetical protein [Burkholderia multivorans]MBU9386785.1 hypothetical protein [Burkholderia multivorans]MBY4792679.1 hypothetical protein [Burkholderia multivorans]
MTLGSSAVHQVSAQARIIDRAYVLRGIVAQAMREARRARAGCSRWEGRLRFNVSEPDYATPMNRQPSASPIRCSGRRSFASICSGRQICLAAAALAGAQTTSTEPWSSQ